MNKATIAGLVAAATVVNAQTACVNLLTKAADDYLAKVTATKAGLDTKLAASKAAAALTATAFTTATDRLTAVQAVLSPFTTAAASAKALTDAQNTAKAAFDVQVTGFTAPNATLVTNISTSTAAVTAANLLVTNAAADLAKLQAVVTETTAEIAALEVLRAAAETADTAAGTEVTRLTGTKAALQAKLDTSTGMAAPYALGWTAISAAAASASAITTTAITTAQTALNLLNTAQKAKVLTNSKAQLEKTVLDTNSVLTGPCNFATGGTTWDCSTQTADPIRVIKEAKTAAASTSLAAITAGQATHDAYLLAVTLIATNKSLDAVARAQTATDAANLVTATALVAAEDVLLVTATGTTKVATAAALALHVASKATATGHLTQHAADLAASQLILNALTTAVTPLNNQVIIDQYLSTDAIAKNAVAVAGSAAASTLAASLLTMQQTAEATVTRATISVTFYSGRLASAQSAKAQDDAAVVKCTADAAKVVLDIAAATAAQTLEVRNCKVAMYGQAQAAKIAAVAAETKRLADVKAAAAAYALKNGFATGGAANTPCAFPAKVADQAQEARPICTEGLCCGAAQKFLKDGTKLSIETCQEALKTHTYQYYPPIAADATVAPTPETWRFQCISGAQKLVAAASAALAASYMMA